MNNFKTYRLHLESGRIVSAIGTNALEAKTAYVMDARSQGLEPEGIRVVELEI